MGITWSKLMRLWWWDSDLSVHREASVNVSTPDHDTGDKKDLVSTSLQPSGPASMELRLMVETDAQADSLHPAAAAIVVDGKHWKLSEPLDIDIPLPYVCVSYVWGPRRAPNTIHPSILMSDRTLSTFAAAARCVPGRPIWIDAFCVPIVRAAKRATLESLGFLFARAEAVVAVLAPESIAAIEEMEAAFVAQSRPEELSEAPIDVLEADEFIRSVWTYQELVNCNMLWLTARVEDKTPLSKAYSGSDALNIIGRYIDRWGRIGQKDRHGIRRIYPHADNFQEILADWQQSGYTQRSALKIMSGMDHRTHVSPQNYFYSMIGALTNRPSVRGTNPTVEQLSERFMELCEEKGDYSFIFSSAPRDSRPGHRWRPVPSMLPGLLTWHSGGAGQRGEKVDGGALLKDVVVLPLALDDRDRTKMNKTMQDFFHPWLSSFGDYVELSSAQRPDICLEEYGKQILECLNFTGDGGWYVTEMGVFYPQRKLPERGEVMVCIAYGVSWVFGAPTMFVVHDELEYVPGVFVGPQDDFSKRLSEFLLK
ncbi:hypothetical protein C8Q79DRAFT_917042 [Trametes meyenii]|nr:hypothetical protein C8Q79DRAFT_917042 [Trametes meyenii]